MSYSDFIVYVDESGDHGLRSIDPQFPVFALSFCIFDKTYYVRELVPRIQDFKFRYWGHDCIVLHEHEIRKQKNDFAFLMTDPALRARFMLELSELIQTSEFSIAAAVVDKIRLRERYVNPWSPYELSLHLCIERLFDFLILNKQEGKTVHLLFECRGRDEDRELELEFYRICHGNQQWGYQRRDFTRINFEARFVKKSANSSGLQLADLTARPIALRTIRPIKRIELLRRLNQKFSNGRYFHKQKGPGKPEPKCRPGKPQSNDNVTFNVTFFKAT